MPRHLITNTKEEDDFFKHRESTINEMGKRLGINLSSGPQEREFHERRKRINQNVKEKVVGKTEQARGLIFGSKNAELEEENKLQFFRNLMESVRRMFTSQPPPPVSDLSPPSSDLFPRSAPKMAAEALEMEERRRRQLFEEIEGGEY